MTLDVRQLRLKCHWLLMQNESHADRVTVKSFKLGSRVTLVVRYIYVSITLVPKFNIA